MVVMVVLKQKVGNRKLRIKNTQIKEGYISSFVGHKNGIFLQTGYNEREAI